MVIGNGGAGNRALGLMKQKNSLKLRAVINDINNNTPQVKLPPVWRIMMGCPAQTLELNPVDADGDRVRTSFKTFLIGKIFYMTEKN